MLYPSWEFIRNKDRGARKVDPAEGLFFENLPPLGAVIRESAQNSLDASLNSSPVRMKISIKTGLNAMDANTASKYLDGLFPHLKASGTKVPNIDRQMDYVVVEDFGTKGLEGDANYFGLGEDDPENRFYWFHRNTNRTSAQTSRGGSYGYGKFAFANASKIKTFFSVSRDKTGIKIFGNTICKNHQLNGNSYPPYGDFGMLEFDDETGEAVMPSDSIDLFNQMSNDFGLSRGNELGLSVIIPFPSKTYSDKEIIESMIRAYFLPICQGKLVIEVDGAHNTVIDSKTIKKICDRQTWSGKPAGAMATTNRKCMNGLIGLAKWWSDGGKEIELNSPKDNNIHWGKELIPEEKYDTIRSRLDSGSPIALNIEVPIYKKLENNRTERYPSKSKFTILIKKDESLGRSDAIWIRRYLSVPKTAYLPNKNGIIAIIISESGILEELLRSSEEVAHTEHRITRIQSSYKYGGEIVRFYRQSAAYLVDYLQEKKELFEKDWIDDWFPSEEIENENKPRKRRKNKKKPDKDDDEPQDDDIIVGPPSPPEDLTNNHLWELQKIPGGFTVHGEIKLEIDYVFRIKLGYAREDGNDSIKKWKSFDFETTSLEIKSEDIVIEKLKDNLIIFRVKGPCEDYSIEVTGFDLERDLSVHCKPTLQRGEE